MVPGMPLLLQRPVKKFEKLSNLTDADVAISDQCKLQCSKSVSKVTIESCSNVEVKLGKVLSGTLEIIRSQNATVTLGEHVGTISVDNSSDITVEVLYPLGGFDAIYHTGVQRVSVVLVVPNNLDAPVPPGGTVEVRRIPHRLPTPQEVLPMIKPENVPLVQFQTVFAEGGRLVTEQVVREGHGYATTVSKKAAADAKDRANRERAERAIEQMIRTGVVDDAMNADMDPADSMDEG